MLILASKSPRRKELLKLITDDFTIIPAVKDEILPQGISPADAVCMLAKQKALEVAQAHKDATVIGADTVVVCDDLIMGKPSDKNDAFAMLKKLSGRVHSVYTGVCIAKASSLNVFFECTDVEFNALSDDEINAYIDTGEPMDKAGAYAVQEKGALLIRRINGDFFNVVGLPVSRLARELRKFS